YVPAADFNGTDTFTYTVSDGNGGTTTGTVSVNVAAVNDGPTTSGGTASGAEDTQIVGQLQASDADGDALSYALAEDGAPQHGSITLNLDGSYTYTPAANFNGTDSFTYTVSDGKGGFATATVALDVAAVNDAPTTAGGMASVTEDTVVTGQIAATDVEGDALTFGLAPNGGPVNGTVTVNPDGSYSYTPAADFNGTDTFTYTVSDGNGGTTTGTITVDVAAVNDGPTTTDGTASSAEDTVVTGQIVASDVDGDTLSYAIAQDGGPQHGAVTINPDGSYSYTPAADFNGTDSFTYTVSDGNGGSTTGTITIDVAAVNDAPTTDGGTASGAEDTPISGQLSASDAEGDPLSYALAQNGGPAHGTVTLNLDGSYTYTPAANFNGTDSFIYTVSDGKGGFATGTVSIDVAGSNDGPTASDGAASGAEDTAITGQIAASDIDGDTLTYSVAQNGAPSHGSVVIAADGSYTYTPSANFNGTDTFTYTVSDGNGGTATATITIDVAAVNDAPTGDGSPVVAAEDAVTTGHLAAMDVDGDALSYALVTGQGPAHGTVTLQPDGTFSYTPAANYNGADSFSYTVTDGKSAPVTVVQQISVENVNDAPVATVGAYLSRQDVPVVGHLQATDIDGDTLTYSAGQGPSHGVLQVNADGTFLYTPATHYLGPDSFTFTVSDGRGGTSSATVAIFVNEVNDAPTAQTTQFSVNEDNVLTGSIGAHDQEGDSFVVSVVNGQGPQHGTVTMQPDGNFVYTPAANYNGADSFTVNIVDQYGASSTQTISVAVAPVHDTPTAANFQITTLEDTPLNYAWATINPDGNALQYRIVSGPTLGNFVINGETGFSYVPGADLNGADRIVYQVSNDGFATSTTGTIDIGITPVNDAPRPTVTAFATQEDTWVRISVDAYDVEGDPVGAFAVSGQGAHGTVTSLGGGEFSYVPDVDFHGTDTFTYTITDALGATAQYTATVEVAKVSNEPVVGDVAVSGNQDTYIYGVLPVSDPDTPLWQYYLLTPVMSNPDAGQFEWVNSMTGEFLFRPTLHWFGTVEVQAWAVDRDGNVSESPGTVTITVIDTNYAPTVDANYYMGNSGYAPQNTPVTGSLQSLGSDTETAQADLTWQVYRQAEHGTVTIDANGDYVYTPNSGYTGWDTFQYQVTDADGAVSNVGTATVYLNFVAAPTVYGAQPEFDAARSGVAVQSHFNVTDVNGPLQFSAIGDAVSSGRLHVNADGTFTYSAPTSFSGTDSFLLQVFDPTEGQATSQMYTFNVAANNGPQAQDENVYVAGGSSLTGALDATDADGDALSYALASGPQHGALQVAQDGSYVYVPNSGFTGTDVFTYVVTDALGATATATTTIEVASSVQDTGGAAQVSLTMTAGTDVVVASAASDTPDTVAGFDTAHDIIDVTALFGSIAPADWIDHITLQSTAQGTYIGVDNAPQGAPEWSLLLANTTVNSLDELLLTAQQNQHA
ncbi:MAG: tandem-95 repeat protein, partial [Rhodospirillales bacterium]|nr:tandem-95 repeat protein [Rhodospirillales bacterium]